MNWYMDAYDLLREFGRLEEANIEYENALKLVHGNKLILENRKRINSIEQLKSVPTIITPVKETKFCTCSLM